MKKYLISFLTLFCLHYLSCSAFAGELYFVKNASKDNLKSDIETILANKNYKIIKKDPYYAISNKDANNYITIILQRSSANYFYYYTANKDTKTNKDILKTLKNRNIVYEQSFNNQYVSTFETQAQKIMTNTTSQYTFQQPKNEVVTIQAQKVEKENVLKGSIVRIAKGTTFNVYLETPINTANADVNDEVRVILNEDFIYEGNIIAQKGSVITGELTKTRSATYGSLNGRVVMRFNKLITDDGKIYDISTEEVDFTVSNDGKWKNAAPTLLTGTAMGILSGILIGASSSNSTLNSSLIGAGVGLGAAALMTTLEKGVDAEIPVYTEIELKLDKPFVAVFSF